MTSTDRKTFKIKVRYFKLSGKWCTDAEFTHEFRTSGAPNDAPNMNDVASYVRGLRNSGGQGAMPGLTDRSEGWEGFILVDHPEAYPVLIV